MCQIVSSHVCMMLRICRRTDIMYSCVKFSICIHTFMHYAYFNVWLCNTEQIIETSIANFPFMTTRPPAIVHHPPKHHLCPMFQNALTFIFLTFFTIGKYQYFKVSCKFLQIWVHYVWSSKRDKVTFQIFNSCSTRWHVGQNGIWISREKFPQTSQSADPLDE